MRMHNPPHPGEIIKRLCLEPLGVSVSEAAQSLRLMKGKVNKLFWIFGFCLIASSCAGPNPNPGERTTDMFWTSGKFERAFAGRSVTVFPRGVSIPQSFRDDPYSLRIRFARSRTVGRVARVVAPLHCRAGYGALLGIAVRFIFPPLPKIRELS